jgi:hypothetical protein
MSLVTTIAFLLYHVWHRNMVQYIRFQQAFGSGCSRAIRCPLMHGNSFRGWGQTLPPRLAVFRLPAVGSLAVAYRISSLTRSTCAPGTVLYPQPLPPGALSSGVEHDSAGPLLLFHQKPASASKKEYRRPRASPESNTMHSPPYPSTQVSVYQTCRLDRGRIWTHVFVVGESTRADQNQDALSRAKIHSVRRYEPHAVGLCVFLCPCRAGTRTVRLHAVSLV